MQISYCSEYQTSKEYTINLMKIARKITLNRSIRSMDEVGRQMENPMVSQLIYPIMQCLDIAHLDIDVAVGGIDQRKIHMLAREYSDDVKITHKPIIVSHHMLKSLKGDDKMSKSIPDSAIFMEDSADEVNRKIKHAFCPAKQVDDNPIFDYIKYLIFPKLGKFELKRQEKLIYATGWGFEGD